MRRLAWLALGLAACQQAAVSPSAQIVGLRDMVRVGEFLFLTSAERDELRVLDLTTGDPAAPRKFVRAPNPIQALSIPVLRRPEMIATDVFYEKGNKREVGGPYVYASNPSSSQISIVWGEDRDKGVRGYTELTRLNTIGPVTAITARGRKATVEGQPEHDTMYFATSGENAAMIFRISLPKPDQLMTDERVESRVRPVATRDGETVVDMVALPNGTLAIATKKRSGGGAAEVIDVMTGRTIVPLQFPGPVRMIYTHPEFDWGDVAPPVTIEAGTRIYGVLDEAACGSVNCGGLVAVDAATGARSQSRVGEKLGAAVAIDQRIAPPITFGAGLINSVSFASNMGVNLPLLEESDFTDGTSTEVLTMVGVASLSNGRIAFFRAAELRPLLTTAGPAATVNTPDGGVYAASDRDAGFIGPTVSLRNGTFPTDETVRITAQADAGYVVSGAVNGYMGQSGPGQTFTFGGRYYFHAADYNPSNPALTLVMPPEPLAAGDFYEITISPFFFPVDLSLSQTICPAGFTSYPGAVLADPERSTFFVAYPSANAILEIPNMVVRRATLLEAGGLLCWR